MSRTEPDGGGPATGFLYLMAGTAVLIGLLQWTGIRYQWSGSGPQWAYRVSPDVRLERGEWVVVCLEGPAAEIARERGYLPFSRQCPARVQPILKEIWALEGDTVDLGGLPAPLEVDALGRPLTAWPSGRVGSGRVWLRSIDDGRDTWDSKYYGPVPKEWIRGSAKPILWPGPPVRERPRLGMIEGLDESPIDPVG